jgi:hypothetical protein
VLIIWASLLCNQNAGVYGGALIERATARDHIRRPHTYTRGPCRLDLPRDVPCSQSGLPTVELVPGCAFTQMYAQATFAVQRPHCRTWRACGRLRASELPLAQDAVG